MSKVKKCSTCKGSKIVMGLGGMEKKCKPCGGVGYVSKIDEKDEEKFLASKSPPKKKAVAKSKAA